MDRYTKELPGAEAPNDNQLWTKVREFTPDWLRDHPGGAVVRLSTTFQGVAAGMETAPVLRLPAPETASCTSIIQMLRPLT